MNENIRENKKISISDKKYFLFQTMFLSNNIFSCQNGQYESAFGGKRCGVASVFVYNGNHIDSFSYCGNNYCGPGNRYITGLFFCDQGYITNPWCEHNNITEFFCCCID